MFRIGPDGILSNIKLKVNIANFDSYIYFCSANGESSDEEAVWIFTSDTEYQEVFPENLESLLMNLIGGEYRNFYLDQEGTPFTDQAGLLSEVCQIVNQST